MASQALQVIEPDVEDTLQEGDDADIRDTLRERRSRYVLEMYPKPTASYLQNCKARMYTTFQLKRNDTMKTREVRYGRDETPQKWRRRLKNADRYHAGIINNEIRRVVAMVVGNLPECIIMPAGSGPRAATKADHQTRWANALLPAMEREHGQLLRPFADGLAEAGYAAFEIYLTGAYDDISTQRRPNETTTSYNDRMQRQSVQYGYPIGIRVPDPLSVYFEPYCDKPERVIIRERKSRDAVYQWALSNNPEAAKKMLTDGKYIPGRTSPGTAHDMTSSIVNTCETVLYYDPYWMVYEVEGQILQCEPHGFARLPVVVADGMITSSAVIEERLQSVVSGMVEDERVLNDLATLSKDNAYRFSSPKAAIFTEDINAQAFKMRDGKPIRIDLTADDSSPILPPGYKVQDVTSQHKPYDTAPLIQQISGNFQRKGLNPVAQGESPGADPAGYTVNMLVSGAQRMYEVLPEQVARAWGDVVDIFRLAVRDCEYLYGQKLYLSAPMSDYNAGGPEWEAIGPNDITEVPAYCVIDPLSDQSRMAKTQWMEKGVASGAISKRRLQTDAYKVRDVTEENKEILRDTARDLYKQMIVQMAWQEAQAEIASENPPAPAPGAGGAPPSGLVGPDGSPIGGAAGGQTGATPAPSNPPTMGGGTRGRTRLNASAGQQPSQQF